MVFLAICHSSCILQTIIKTSLPVCWNSSWAYHSTITAKGKRQKKEKEKKDWLYNKKKYLTLGFNKGLSLLQAFYSPLIILIKPIDNSPGSCQFSIKVNKKVNAGAIEGQHWFRRDFPSLKLKAFRYPTQKKIKQRKKKQKCMSLIKNYGLRWPKEKTCVVYSYHKHTMSSKYGLVIKNLNATLSSTHRRKHTQLMRAWSSEMIKSFFFWSEKRLNSRWAYQIFLIIMDP